MIPFVREYGLVRNSSDDAHRGVRMVRWEGRWSAADAEGYEDYSLTPVAWEWTMLLAGGAVRQPVVTRITVLSGVQPTPWPRDAARESEELRRMRIRALRAACHVDPDKGSQEPPWYVEPSINAAA